LNRDGLFRIALDGLCGTAMYAIGEVLHDLHDNLWFFLLQDLLFPDRNTIDFA
jgi:hypothetical protein